MRLQEAHDSNCKKILSLCVQFALLSGILFTTTFSAGLVRILGRVEVSRSSLTFQAGRCVRLVRPLLVFARPAFDKLLNSAGRGISRTWHSWKKRGRHRVWTSESACGVCSPSYSARKRYLEQLKRLHSHPVCVFHPRRACSPHALAVVHEPECGV